MEKLQELFTDRVNNTLGATKKHFYDKFEIEKNLNRLDMLKQFIKWLVQEGKIDMDSLLKNDGKFRVFYFLFKYHNISAYKRIVMYLAMQEKPIDVLIKLIKNGTDKLN